MTVDEILNERVEHRIISKTLPALHLKDPDNGKPHKKRANGSNILADDPPA